VSRAEAITEILRLLPRERGVDSADVRLRLERMSTRELSRLSEYLDSLVERRALDDSHRVRWEAAQARVQDLSSISELIAEFHEVNQTSRELMQNIREKAAVVDPVVVTADQTSGTVAETEDKSATLESPFEVREFALEFAERMTDAELDARFSAFARLRRLASSQLLEHVDAPFSRDETIVSILPWDWLRCRLAEMNGGPEGQGAVELTDRRVKQFTRFLRALRPGSTPNFGVVGAYRTDSVMVDLTNTLWRYPVQYLPRGIEDDLIRFIDRADRRLVKKIDGTISPREVATLAQIVMRGNLLISRIRAKSGRLQPHDRARNLASAFVVAQSAGFISSRPWFLESAMLTELLECADAIPALPSDYVALCTRSGKRTPPIFGLMIDAADVLRFAAQVMYRLHGDLDRALKFVAVADTYYENARGLAVASELQGASAQRQRYLDRITRLRLLQAAVAKKRLRPDEVVQLMRDAVDAIRKSPSSQISEEVKFLKARALVTESLSSTPSPELDAMIVETLNDLIANNPLKLGAWRLLVDHYVYAKDEPEKALALIPGLIASLRSSAPSAVSYMEYRRAQIWLAIANESPRRATEAARAYVDLIALQAKNAVAIDELLSVRGMLSEMDLSAVRPYVDRVLPDSTDLSWTHAAVRASFGLAPTTISGDRLAAAFAALLASGSDSDAKTFGELIGRRPGLQDRFILERLSLHYLRRGRDSGNPQEVAAAERLLEAGLFADPTDLFWIGRRLDIALERRDMVRAHELLTLALKQDPTDRFLRFQEARVALLDRRPGEASEILNALLSEASESDRPGIIDQLALAALQRRDLDEAEHYYRINIDQQPFDPRSFFGIGRINFERGRDYWPSALRNWGDALKLQQDVEDANGRFVSQTAQLIAGLFKHKCADEKLLEELSHLLTVEPQVIRPLAQAFSSRSVADGVLDIVTTVAEKSKDFVTNRKVAQLLRARMILDVDSTSTAALITRAAGDIEWCRGTDVLSDYLAGSKGTYARALLRRFSDSLDINPGRRASSAFYSGNWAALQEHVAFDGYVPNYYRIAKELTSEIWSAPVEEIACFSIDLIFRVMDSFASLLKRPEAAIARCELGIGLLEIAEIGKLDSSNPPALAAWVDEDVFRIASTFMNGDGWRNAGDKLVRVLDRLPNPDEMRQLSRGGIYIRPAQSGVEKAPTAYVRVLPESSQFEQRDLLADRGFGEDDAGVVVALRAANLDCGGA
jgi:tetratricopeptide (TPR) repeat protein